MLEGFVHPAFAGLTALAAVPLIIHLLNRQRHRPVQWAAMRFVLAAYKKTRRRVQLENLLLLLLRMGAVALLALAIARPFAAGDGALGKLTEARRDLILVLDGSASTGYTQGIETVFERIVKRATELVEELEGDGANRVYVILAGDRPRLLSWPSPEKAASVLGTLSAPLDEGMDLAAALAEVRRLAEDEAAGAVRSSLDVRLLTDLQRNAFLNAAGALDAQQTTSADELSAAGLIDQLDALQAMDIQVQVEDLGPGVLNPANLGIVDVALVGDAMDNGPLQVNVTVANYGTSRANAVRVGFSLDGNRYPSRRVDVPAQGTGEAVFHLPSGLQGAQALEATLEGDRLTADDTRASVLLLPDPVRVLLVNGTPSDRFEDDAVGFLEIALAAPEFGAAEDTHLTKVSPFDVRVVTPSALVSGEVLLAEQDVIWLANTPPLAQSVLTALEERVAAGASLIISMGDRVGDAGRDGRGLFRADGTGLLPAELGRRVAAQSRESFFQVGEFDGMHPALQFYNDEALQRLLTQVPFHEFVLARPLTGSRVLASLNDSASSPLLIERHFAAGKVLVWTSTMHPDWTPFPALGKTFIPFVLELVRYAGGAKVLDRDIAPGAPLRIELADFPRSPSLVRPDETRRGLDGAPESTPAGAWLLPPLGEGDTRRAGLYKISVESGAEHPFAVQLDPAEGNLERMGQAELAGLHPALIPFRPADAGDDSGSPAGRGEIWRWLAMLCLAALVTESLFGAWLGRKRRSA
ncbi:MAG: hypothetical protein ACI8QC_000023 [Planctomycetota bacterium]|jgi:hypothetical protein